MGKTGTRGPILSISFNEALSGAVQKYVMQNLFHLFICTFSLFCSLEASVLDEMDHMPLSFESKEPLFVSLGPFCEPAHFIRHCGLRKAAFPFDWAISQRTEQICETLDHDFAYFLNPDDLRMDQGVVYHTRHLFEFPHDGDRNSENYQQAIEAFQHKYARRIDRFRQLNQYQGKVIFLRWCWYTAQFFADGTHQVLTNDELSKEEAWKLYQSLRAYFPDLDFTLVLINVHDRSEFEEDEPLSETLRIFRVNPHFTVPEKIEIYRRFFDKLLAEYGGR